MFLQKQEKPRGIKQHDDGMLAHSAIRHMERWLQVPPWESKAKMFRGDLA